MEGWTPLVFLVAAAGIVVTLMITAGAKRSIDPELQVKWERVSRRLGGRLLTKEGDFRVRFRWNGVDAVLFQGDPVRFSIPDAGFENISFILSDPRSDLLDADQEVVPGFHLATSDLPAAREFFTSGVRKILDGLKSLGKVTQVEIEKEFEVIAAPGNEPDHLVMFVSLCLQLAQHAWVFGSRDGNVKVVAESATDPGLCQICGADLEGDLVACAKCATRHHRDCWEYTGVCSTYGCGERKATKS